MNAEEEKKADGGKVKIPPHLMEAKSAPKPAWMQKLASKNGGLGTSAHSAKSDDIVDTGPSGSEHSPQSKLASKLHLLHTLMQEEPEKPAADLLGPITTNSDEGESGQGEVYEEVLSTDDEEDWEEEVVEEVANSPPTPVSKSLLSKRPGHEEDKHHGTNRGAAVKANAPPRRPTETPVDKKQPPPVDQPTTFNPKVPDTFAPPGRYTGSNSRSADARSLPKQPSMALSTLPRPPSRSTIKVKDYEPDEDDSPWLMPHRNEDDSSWVNPSHPIEPNRKQKLADDLKQKSVDLFPQDGNPSNRLAKIKSIDEESKLNDLEYDAKVGLIVGDAHKGDGQSISETSFSVNSRMDKSARIMESSVPKKENEDVWSVPANQEKYYGKLDTHRDGKDYRFSYIAQQHTHNTASYADVVRERYFPKEDNEYWAAPAKETTPELPIHISRNGTIEHGPKDESWMPPENDPADNVSVDKRKYYAPTIAEEYAESRAGESRSVITEESDWMGRDVGGKGTFRRIDFTGTLRQESSDNSFEWNPAMQDSQILEDEIPSAGRKAQGAVFPDPPSVEGGADDEFDVNPVALAARSPSPPTRAQESAVESAPSTRRNKYELSPSGRKRKVSYSPSGRLKFDETPKTIVLDDEDEQRGGGYSQKRSVEQTQKRIVCYLALCFFLVLVPAAVACIVIFVVDPNNRRDDDSPPTRAPVAAPTSPPTRAPTPNIFPPPTPGQQPSAPSPPVDEDLLLEFLTQLSTDGGEALRDPTSPQYAAMQWLRSDANQGIFDDVIFIQRFALATLYYSSGGEQWTSSSGWMTEASECEWYSSSTSSQSICDADGRLLELNLSNNNLAGTIPPELNLLSAALSKFAFSFNFMQWHWICSDNRISECSLSSIVQQSVDGSSSVVLV